LKLPGARRVKAPAGATRPVLENAMPLLCELGWHDAIPAARWNEGYYFTKCRRCRQDLVRTAYSGWHIPNGFRIVWQGRPPGDRPSARLVVDPDVSGQETR